MPGHNRFWTSNSFFKSAPISCSSCFLGKILKKTFFSVGKILKKFYDVSRRPDLPSYLDKKAERAPLPLPCTTPRRHTSSLIHTPATPASLATPSFPHLPLGPRPHISCLNTELAVFCMYVAGCFGPLYFILWKWMENPLFCMKCQRLDCAWWNARLCSPFISSAPLHEGPTPLLTLLSSWLPSLLSVCVFFSWEKYKRQSCPWDSGNGNSLPEL